MKKILANDGIDAEGRKMLENAGFSVNSEKVAQENLPDALPGYDIVLVRSATKIRQKEIDAGKNLRLIGRAGVGLDNVDVVYAEAKGIKVMNTPAASSQSVAELVFAHLYGLARQLNDANRNMPLTGDSEFKVLKEKYSQGVELRGKTFGIIGFGRIGQATAAIAIGLGMKVVASDPHIKEADINLSFSDGSKKSFLLKTITQDEVLTESDFITLHVPGSGAPLITSKEIAMMKNGVYIINASRGGVIDENDLITALDSGKIAGAGLDVFANEPTPEIQLLMHPNISLSPHIGASTVEAQRRIGIELAEKVIAFFKEKQTL